MAINKPKNLDKQEVSHPQLKKTKICSFFQQGRCRYGQSCTFAHDMGELEATPDLMKTQLCKHWVLGICPLASADCRFAHGKKDLRRANSSRKGEEDVSAVVAANPTIQTILTGAPAAWPINIDAHLEYPCDLAAVTDDISPALPPGLEAFAACQEEPGPSKQLLSHDLEPMKVTPSFSICGHGGILPALSPAKLQLGGRDDTCDSLPATAYSTEAPDSSDEDASPSSTFSDLQAYDKVYDTFEDWTSVYGELSGMPWFSWDSIQGMEICMENFHGMENFQAAF